MVELELDPDRVLVEPGVAGMPGRVTLGHDLSDVPIAANDVVRADVRREGIESVQRECVADIGVVDDDVVDLALEIKLDGLVATNTTIDRTHLSATDAELNSIGAGGLSGLPLMQKSTDIVRYIFEKSGGKIPLIASGGIFNAADAKEKKDAGASLMQVWTGFIYEGPGIVKKICKGL